MVGLGLGLVSGLCLWIMFMVRVKVRVGLCMDTFIVLQSI